MCRGAHRRRWLAFLPRTLRGRVSNASRNRRRRRRRQRTSWRSERREEKNAHEQRYCSLPRLINTERKKKDIDKPTIAIAHTIKMRPYREIKCERLSYCGYARHESVYRTDGGNGGTGRTKKPCTTLRVCACAYVCVGCVRARARVCVAIFQTNGLGGGG